MGICELAYHEQALAQPDDSNNSDTLDVPVLEPLPALIFRDGFEPLE